MNCPYVTARSASELLGRLVVSDAAKAQTTAVEATEVAK